MFDLTIGPSLAFIGFCRPAFGAVPPLSELSSRYWALLLTGELTLDVDVAREKMLVDKAYEERLFPRDAKRLQSLVQYQRTMNGLASLVGCAPALEQLQVSRPEIFERMVRSGFCAAQFRLSGPGAMTEECMDILARLPLPKYGRAKREMLHQFLEGDAG
ncbi:hypothetical protein TrRE_jg1716 [Triparma retinervis]|uniref:Uncharacterized protein n=1 Tax=Triparma retinervis TaxID=2557542 RepID=A0A9W7EC78_9STRA|nr:hypothetical protein TrRE_jg1716 [Triparma retinervis]